MKRLGIYLVFDKQKKIDGYIGYFLKELKTCVSTLVVICNMEEIVQGEENIRPYADRIYFRKNVGFDAGGLKDALCRFIGWDTVLQYDELVLANDSMFGPFCPMTDIFDEMDKKPADFWGLIKHGEYRKNERHIPKHIQSFFLVIRTRLLHSECFQYYWEDMPYFTSHEQTINEYEIKFTSYFSQLGYTYETLADSETNDSSNLEGNYCQYAYIPYELLNKRKFPFLKKKPLGMFKFEGTKQLGFCHALNYIEQKTDYPVELIWEEIIRIFNISDIYKRLHLQYIISPLQGIKNARAAILVFISYESSFEFVCEYLERLSGPCGVIVCAESQGILAPYAAFGYECRQLSLEEFPYFLSGFHTYDYVCVLHDTDMTSLVNPSYVGKSLFYSIWENLVKDMGHVSGVIAQFEKAPYLGFLTVPQDCCGERVCELGLGWNGRYGEVCGAVDRLSLTCNLSEATPPYRVTNDFWVRGSILRKLERMDPGDIPLLPYLWSYLAQDSGYYSGVVECAEYAAMNEINLQYYLDQICDQVRTQYGEFHNFVELQKLIGHGAVQDFCKKYSRIYAYGTGIVAKRYQDILFDIEAYIVSDGQPKQDTFCGHPVQYLSEVDLSDDCGIVLCLTKNTQEKVIKLLREQNFDHYFCV